MKDIPSDLATFVCTHVFEDFSKASYVVVDDEGDLCVSCGCGYDEAKVVAFGHIKVEHPDLLSKPMLSVSTSYKKNALGLWV